MKGKLKKWKGYKVYCHIVRKEISGYDYDKYYIGITNRNTLEERFGKNGKYYERQIFNNAIRKYGWNNIEHRLLFDNLDFETACEIEKSLIKDLDCKLGHKGYNNTDGGDGRRGSSNPEVSGIYCLEYNCIFRNPTEASYVTGDDERQIRTICQRNSERIKHHDETYTNTYCYMNLMAKYRGRNKQKTRPIITIKDDEVYSCISEIEEKLNITLSRNRIIKYDEYLKLESKDKLYKVDRYMYADEYLKVFNHSKIHNRIEQNIQTDDNSIKNNKTYKKKISDEEFNEFLENITYDIKRKYIINNKYISLESFLKENNIEKNKAKNIILKYYDRFKELGYISMKGEWIIKDLGVKIEDFEKYNLDLTKTNKATTDLLTMEAYMFLKYCIENK